MAPAPPNLLVEGSLSPTAREETGLRCCDELNSALKITGSWVAFVVETLLFSPPLLVPNKTLLLFELCDDSFSSSPITTSSACCKVAAF